MNKKAQELAVFGIIAFLLIILVLTFYWFFMVIPSKVKGITEQSITARDKINIDLVLVNYLRTPVDVNNEKILMSDLIRLYNVDNQKYESKLKEETQKIFDKIFENYNYQLIIGDKQFVQVGYKAYGEGVVVRNWVKASSILPLTSAATINIDLEVFPK